MALEASGKSLKFLCSLDFFFLFNSVNCVIGLWGPADAESVDLSVCFLRRGRLHLDVLGVSLGLLMEAKE